MTDGMFGGLRQWLWRPLLGLALAAILTVLWIYAASRFLRTNAWDT
jgi:hypothetical protein